MNRMRVRLTDGRLAFILILAIIIIDQIIKVEVKTNMCLGESIHVTDWFYISFIENNGMAYGMTLGSKLVLSIMRIIAICCIGWYISSVVRAVHHTGYVMVLSMILAGAAGNVFDSMFYGLCFNESSPFVVSHFVDFGTGYASFLEGKVVDMFYFPLIVTTWPEWVPLYGGQEFIFFSPVFNFADACISVGVVLLLIFYRKDMEGMGNTFRNSFPKKADEHTES
uniref:Lipoprotein signal peptidase n=1 Tax=Prevotella sp. GTC17253 TaxID=3236793 RepID=A0AB33IPT7_9BACT